jgi:hypothetical protein
MLAMLLVVAVDAESGSNFHLLGTIRSGKFSCLQVVHLATRQLQHFQPRQAYLRLAAFFPMRGSGTGSGGDMPTSVNALSPTSPPSGFVALNTV